MGLAPRVKARIRKWQQRPATFVKDVLRWREPGMSSATPLRLELYQREFLNCPKQFRAVNKGRQVGYSFAFAVEALTQAYLRPGSTIIFVSKEKSDSVEKINRVHELIEYSPLLRVLCEFRIFKQTVEVRRKGSRIWSKIKSWACKAPRGQTIDYLYLDEFAHYQNANEVYLGSVPAIIRAGLKARITVASTPNGRQGKFWDLYGGRDSERWWKQFVPWWRCERFCLDVVGATRNAPAMPTEDRVEKYGTDALKMQFETNALPDFQQEMEGDFLDDGMSYYPLTLLENNIVAGLSLCEELDEVLAVRQGDVFIGADIGRSNDTTEVVFLDRFEDDTAESGYAYAVLKVVTMDRVEWLTQTAEFKSYLGVVGLVRHAWIDCTGHGNHIYEELREFAGPDRVTGVWFSAPKKEAMCVLVRRMLEERLLELPDQRDQPDAHRRRLARDLVDEIHSIKRTPTETKVAKYETGATTHHGDKFWALALACVCAFHDLKPGAYIEELKVLG